MGISMYGTWFWSEGLEDSLMIAPGPAVPVTLHAVLEVLADPWWHPHVLHSPSRLAARPITVLRVLRQ